MEAGGDAIPLGDRSQSQSQSQSQDRLTESTVFSLSQSESLWTTESARSAWEVYQYPILLLASGGAVFICGFVLSGLYFAAISKKVTNILGPALLSIGLMVLVVGLVLVPITKENLKPPLKRPVSYYRPPHFNL
ncbi:phosphoinositide-interacting protein-like [Conger conger]|uniref:phosphoinositide-interacting protein-like n=1 Tax=Conger conger TaxID=82655 RepID=UPI002A5B0989|nr:phosphoinositide-interacting protein-like [Conger conger]